MLFTHYSLLITYHLLKGRLYMKEYKIELTVNDEKLSAAAKPEESLLKFLRRNGFTEVKCGCEKGECGTCTVILNKKAVKSCIVLALQANHKEVWTVKGCLLYTSDAADEEDSVDLGGRRIIKKKKKKKKK